MEMEDAARNKVPQPELWTSYDAAVRGHSTRPVSVPNNSSYSQNREIAHAATAPVQGATVARTTFAGPPLADPLQSLWSWLSPNDRPKPKVISSRVTDSATPFSYPAPFSGSTVLEGRAIQSKAAWTAGEVTSAAEPTTAVSVAMESKYTSESYVGQAEATYNPQTIAYSGSASAVDRAQLYSSIRSTAASTASSSVGRSMAPTFAAATTSASETATFKAPQPSTAGSPATNRRQLYESIRQIARQAPTSPALQPDLAARSPYTASTSYAPGNRMPPLPEMARWGGPGGSYVAAPPSAGFNIACV